MKTLNVREPAKFVSLMALCLSSTIAYVTPARGDDKRAPAVPAALEVAAENKVHVHTRAEGVQIYSWNGSSWVFVAPEAVLFDADGNIVGTHYAGPTWEGNSGSKVVAVRIASAPSATPSSIPLLLLQATVAENPGIFARTTFIHRVNTVGGVAPPTPGASTGEEVRVPYTADYYFYRAK